MKDAVRRFFGGEQQQPRPKICPACGALVGISATRCHECGVSLRFSLAALSKEISRHFGGRAPATTVLLIVNILMFAVSWMATASAGESGGLRILWGMGGEALYRLGASNPYGIFALHQWFRLVTAMFLHGGLIHIGFNMMVLMDVGPPVEEVYGSARFLFLYTTTGIAGFFLSALHGRPSVGASGAILGLIGLMIAITTKRGGAMMHALRSRLISWVVSIFVIGFLLSGVDNWAHFGGLAAGFGLGKLFADREPMSAREKQTAYALGWLAGLIVLGSFVMMILHYRDTLPWQS
jgi:rhomboid protease GluP